MAKIKKFDEGGDANFLKVFRKEELEKRADLLDAKKLEKQMEVQQGGKVYMGDPYKKPATQQELDDFQKDGIGKKTNPLIAITNKIGSAVDRGLDTLPPFFIGFTALVLSLSLSCSSFGIDSNAAT